MNYTVTINASTPEELSAILAKLHTTEVQAPAAQAIQTQLNYQQHQSIAPTVSPQAMQPGFTPDPSYQQPAQQQYQQQPDQQGYGQQAPVQQGYQQQPGQAPMQSAVPTSAPVQQQAQQQPTNVPVAAQTYTMDQLAVAATQLMDAGRQAELLNLLNNTYGAPSLMALPKEQYGNFATALRQMGAKI